jgi:hypothetical protein
LIGSRKNGNCFVEQKNYASARKIIGYGRLSGEKGIAALQTARSAYDNLLNCFYPWPKTDFKRTARFKNQENL